MQPTSAESRVYVTWHDWRRSNTIFLNYSLDAGDTFQPEDIEVTAPGRPTGTFSDWSMTTDDRGFLHIFWRESLCPSAHFNRASPTLSLGLVAPTEPSIVPAAGGTILAEASLLNTSASMLSGLSVWIDATFPSGATSRPKIGPVSLSLGSAALRSREVRLRIPGKLRPGLYQINLRSGGPVCDRATLPILKMP